MLIHFLSSPNLKGYFYTYPLRAFARQLQDLGLTVRTYLRPNSSLPDCDVLCLGGSYFAQLSGEEKVPLMARYRQKAPVIVWFDTSDSTGTPYFDAMPFVDLYAKSFVLRDRALYTQEFYGLRCYAHYYHAQYGIEDLKERKRRPARPEELAKIALSWNSGLGNEDINHNKFLRIGLQFGLLTPWAGYRPRPASPRRTRDIGISYRSGGRYYQATVAYQREETYRRLSEIAGESPHRIICEGPIPYARYIQELKNTLLAPSPFGWGETSYRDYDIFLAGAALSKPDIGHLETWPDYYEPNETYIPHAWDFSDFQEVIEGCLESPSRCTDIAQAGQDRYLQSLSHAGGEAFAEHFSALMHQAQRMATASATWQPNE
jgi:hypothetical protein